MKSSIHIISLALALGFISCSKTTETSYSFDTIPEARLTEPDTICRFEDKFPTAIEIFDDNLFVTFANQDSILEVYDLQSGQHRKSFRTGSGPEDLMTPSFFRNNSITPDGNYLLYDLNVARLLSFSGDSLKLTQSTLPAMMRGNASINYDGKTIVSGPMMNTEDLLYIKDSELEEEHTVAIPFELSEATRKTLSVMPTYLASNINANFSKKRIIASMYYFDAYLVYDFDGKLLAAVYPSDTDFDLNRTADNFFSFDKDGFWRYAPGYASDSAMYLRRVRSLPLETREGYDDTSAEIVKVSWDGAPELTVGLPEEFKAFCVAPSGDIIAIVQSIDGDNECYNIIRYKLEDVK